QRRDEPERHADQNRERHRREDQLQRRPHPLGDHGRDRLAGADRVAEIAYREPGDVGAEADIDRLVEPELLLHALLDLWGTVISPAAHDAATGAAVTPQ